MQSAVSQLSEKAGAAYGSAMGLASIDPIIISIIIDIVMNLLSGCLSNRSPEDVGARLANPGIIEKWVIRREVNRHARRQGMGSREERAMVEAITGTMEETPPESLVGLCLEVKNGVPEVPDWSL